MTDSARFSWTVLLPVKVLARAKSRLAVLAGDRRRELALALASDTVTAVLACPEVARVVVVTSDPVAGPLLAALGAIVVADEPADRPDRLGPVDRLGTPGALDGAGAAPALGDLGVQDLLNAALRHGAAVAARRWPGTGLAALTADLPAMSPAELATALRAAGTAPGARGVRAGRRRRRDDAVRGAARRRVPAAVRRGVQGTARGGGRRRTRTSTGMAGLRRDVDTPDDLREALALGVGPFTRAVAADLFTDV